MSVVAGVPQSPVSQVLKCISDQESRDPITRRHRFGFHKCCQCPPLEYYWSLSGFSKTMQLERNASIRLCLLHDGSQGESGTPVSFTTPTPKDRRQLISPPPQAAIDIPTEPAGMIDLRGGRTGSKEADFHIPTAPAGMIDM